MVFMIKMELGDLNEIPALWQDNLTELLSFPDQWREARQGRREGPCRIIRFQERRDRGIGRAVPRGGRGGLLKRNSAEVEGGTVRFLRNQRFPDVFIRSDHALDVPRRVAQQEFIEKGHVHH